MVSRSQKCARRPLNRVQCQYRVEELQLVPQTADLLLQVLNLVFFHPEENLRRRRLHLDFQCVKCPKTTGDQLHQLHYLQIAARPVSGVLRALISDCSLSPTHLLFQAGFQVLQ